MPIEVKQKPVVNFIEVELSNGCTLTIEEIDSNTITITRSYSFEVEIESDYHRTTITTFRR